jgi:hypothetical protein
VRELITQWGEASFLVQFLELLRQRLPIGKRGRNDKTRCSTQVASPP